MKDNIIYILVVLFAGLGIYWTIATYQSDKERIKDNCPLNTYSENILTKDALPVSIHGRIYYDPQTYKTDDAINANYLINSCLRNEIIKYNRQDFLNDSIVKSIFNHVNNSLKQEYSGMYWGYTTIYPRSRMA